MQGNLDAMALLNTFIESEDDGPVDEENETEYMGELTSTKWMMLINRGGLHKCNNDFYVFIRTAELAFLESNDKPFEVVKGSNPHNLAKMMTRGEEVGTAT